MSPQCHIGPQKSIKKKYILSGSRKHDDIFKIQSNPTMCEETIQIVQNDYLYARGSLPPKHLFSATYVLI